MAITSQVKQPLTIGEALIQDWQVTGLIKPSVFKPLIATIEKDRIIKVIGQLTEKDQQSLQEIISVIIGCQRRHQNL